MRGKNRIKRDVYTFYLKTGARLTFQASEVTLRHSLQTGELASYKIVDMRGECPMFIDIDQIAAVTKQ